MSNIAVTTSIPQEMWNLAKEKHLKWSECLILGINTFANQHLPMIKDETIVEKSEILKKNDLVVLLQDKLLEATDELEEMKKKR